MKKLYILFIALLVTGGVMAQGCLPEGIRFLTQSQVDSFQILYPNCTRIEGPLYIGGYSPVLSNVSNLNGLSAITYVGALDIEYSDSLTSLSGLNNIDTIGGFFTMAGNYNLSSLVGLEKLKHIGGSLNIGTTILSPLSGWVAVGTGLETLTGLENIHSIGGNLGIRGNNSLSSISELNNVNSIDGGIYLWQNNSLENISGLSNIDASSIDTLSVSENYSLSICEIESICDYLLNPNTVPYINDNAVGCNTQEEVETACENASVGELNQSNRLLIYPNPTSSKINIETSTTPHKNTTLTICNLNGQELMTRQIIEPKTVVDVSGLPQGGYFVKVMNDDKVMVGKVIKQ